MIGGTPQVAAQGRGNNPARPTAGAPATPPPPAAAPLGSAAPTAVPAPTLAVTPGPVKAAKHDMVKQHEERVAMLEREAGELYSECWVQTESMRKKELTAVTERATKRVEEKLANLKSDLTATQAAEKLLEAAAEKLATDLEAEKRSLAAARPDDEKQKIQARIDVIEAQEKSNEATLKARRAREVQIGGEATAVAASLATIDNEVKSAFARFDMGVGICKELCSRSPAGSSEPTSESPLDLCSFQAPVLATAAVIADWRSVDLLSGHVGAPRAGLEAMFDITVPELPGDATGSQRSAGRSRGGTGGDTEMVPAAAGGALAAMDLSSTAAQTAGVALAALAKVIEDRAKRESLVWFLEQMSREVCGDPQKAVVCDADKADALLKDAGDAEKGAVLAKEAAVESEKAAQAVLGKTQSDTNLAAAAAALPAAKKALDAAKEKKDEATENEKNAKEALTKAKAASTKAHTCAAYGPVTREVRAYWLPMTCTLAATRDDYVQYGGGAHLLRALQGAVASDVRSWPGVAAGAGAGAVYWRTMTDLDTLKYKQKDLGRMFRCDPSNPSTTTDPICPATVRLRRATARFVTKIQNGGDAMAEMGVYGTAIDELNAAESGSHVLNDPFQVAACMLSLPSSFRGNENLVQATTADRKEELQALFLSSIATAQACWTIVGQGWNPSACTTFGGKPTDDAPCALTKHVASRKVRLERLSTLLRLHASLAPATDRVLTQWGTVQSAWEKYLAAFEALKGSGGGAPFVPPTFDAGTVNDARTFAEVLKGFDAYIKSVARSAQDTEQVKLLQASAALAHASLDLGVALTDGLAAATDANLYPGLSVPNDLQTVFVDTSKQLQAYSGYVAGVESALNQDWGAMVARIVTLLRSEIEKACRGDEECRILADRLSRYSGLFTALISEKDPEKVAQALDAAAMPIGGWRHKQIEGAKTLTVGAFPGLTFGMGFEKRWGQYGVVREDGKELYWTPPVLQMPFGIDLAFGYETKSGGNSWGLFLSLLDPAAYLSYDPDKEGRLPGAQILTALSPGLALHQSLGESPFVITGYVVARPNFRSWQSDAAAPGATVLQAGLSLAVDVTLFEIWASRPE